MLSYRHSFHAGNHADVLKHTVQSLIIEALKEKEKPFLYLDTHAGAGRYQLSGEHAERTGEYLEGIARIWQQDDLPAELEPYISVVEHFNRNGQLRYYPGSPLIARQLLREQDSLQMTELHPSDFPLLRAEFQKDSRARVDKADGYQQLKAKLPPVSRRGLILIDPPYEIKTDYQAVVTGINEGYKRFATGTYALWYPVVLRAQIKRMIKDLEATGIRKILQKMCIRDSTMAYKHILIAVDLSPESKVLVEKAVSMARPYNAKVSLIHVDVNYSDLYTGLIDVNLGDMQKRISEETHHALTELSTNAGYPITETLSGSGDLGQVLVDAIKKYDMDLVVCGHHQDFWSKLMSSARQLINTVHVDMLIVPLRDEEDE